MKKTGYLIIAALVGLGLTTYIAPLQLPKQISTSAKPNTELTNSNNKTSMNKTLLQNAALYSDDLSSGNIQADMLEIKHSMDRLDRDMDYIKSYKAKKPAMELEKQ